MNELVSNVGSRDELKRELSRDTFKNRNTNRVLYPYSHELGRMTKHPDSYTYGTTKYQAKKNQAIKEYATGKLDLAGLKNSLVDDTASREEYHTDTNKLISFLEDYEKSRNAKWSPSQQRLVDQRNAGEINDDTFRGEITKYKYGKFTEFHEPLLEKVLSTPQAEFGYQRNKENIRSYKKWNKENSGLVNRAGVDAFTSSLRLQQPLITKFRVGKDGKTEAYKEVNDSLRLGFNKLADKMDKLYIEKGIRPNEAWKYYTPEESQIARDGRQQLDALFSSASRSWVNSDDSEKPRDSSGRVNYKDPKVNYTALDQMTNIKHDIDWRYFSDAGLDKNKKAGIQAFRDYIGNENLEGIKIQTTLDTRGRNYQNMHKADDNVITNPLANQDIKPIRAMISFSDKQRVDDLEELKIHTANQFGLDKKPYKDRIAWFDKNEKNLESIVDSADEPAMAKRAIDEYKNVKQGKPSGLVAYADAISSGVQIKAALHSDPLSLQLTGATTTERPDLYTHVANSLINKKIVDRPIDRSTAKDAILKGGYGSSQVGKTIVWETYKRDINKVIKDTPFTPSNITPDILNHDKYHQFRVEGLSNESAFKLNEDKIRDFHHKFQHDAMFRKLQRKKERVLDLTAKFPGLKPYKEKAQKALDEYNDILRSEARFNNAMLDSVDYMKDENMMVMPDLQEAQGRLRTYKNENIEAARSFAANFTHAYDGWITREVANLGSLDKKALMKMRYNQSGGRSSLSAKNQGYKDYYDKSGYLSSFFLNNLSTAEYNGLDNNTKKKVDEMIADLPNKQYQVKLVHDSFGSHPNNMKDVKQQYTNVIKNIYNTEGKLLNHTFKQWTGKELPYKVITHSSDGLFEKGNYLIN